MNINELGGKLQKDLISQTFSLLKKSVPITAHEVADAIGCSPDKATEIIHNLMSQGLTITETDGRFLLAHDLVPGGQSTVQLTDRGDGWMVFGCTSDNHLGSKHYRHDVLHKLYDIYAEEGVQHVFNSGNWIEGEARFNRHDISVHGLTDQVDFMLNEYPQRKGIKTHYVAGDDHEGWYVQRELVDIGQYVEDKAKAGGRFDLNYLGYMEADVELKQPGGSSTLRVQHGGGGSAYALSYTLQKMVECVPLDTEILTRDGWKTHGHISVGAEVLGYNQETGLCEWTEITALNFGDGEVLDYANDHFRVRVTREHKWPMWLEHRAGPNPESVESKPYSKTNAGLYSIENVHGDWRRARIIQAAPAPSGDGFSIDEHEDWLDREDSVAHVLKMTSSERRGFIFGMMLGEGTDTGSSLVFNQRPGAVNDAFRLACFLEGIATGSSRISTKKIDGEEKICCRTTMLRKNLRMVNSMRLISSTFQAVWCPTTKLGTWVMRQGETITITGNSYQGGEKPTVLSMGHHHKFCYAYPRNVHAFMPGCTQDQSMFMRKNKIEAHVGGVLVWLKQEKDGTITRFRCEWIPFYDRGFYERRFAI